MGKIKVIIKRPDEQYGHEEMIDNELKAYQQIVGGHIETVPAIRNAIMICNEEGWLLKLPFNLIHEYGPIVGTVIVCGVSGEEFSDVPITFDQWAAYVDRMMERLT